MRSLALRALLACAASAGIAAGVATVLQRGDTDAASRRPPVPATPRLDAAEVTAVPAAEASAFGILRRPLTPTDAFKQIRRGSGPFGANPALARTAPLPVARSPLAPELVSVVPASGGVCLRILVDSSYARWWCLPLARAARGSLIVTLLPPSPTPHAATTQYVLGLVPDGVGSVTITSGDGVGHKVAVRSNVYATALFKPGSVKFELPGRGPVTLRIRD